MASRGWDWVKRQEDLLTGGGRWWSWRIFSAVSLLPDTDGAASGSLLDSVLSTLLNNNNKKTIQECLGSSSCSLITDDTVALDWILNGCYNLCVLFYVWVLCLKTNSASSNKENPLAISSIRNLFSYSVTSSFCLSLCFLWACSHLCKFATWKFVYRELKL